MPGARLAADQTVRTCAPHSPRCTMPLSFALALAFVVQRPRGLLWAGLLAALMLNTAHAGGRKAADAPEAAASATTEEVKGIETVEYNPDDPEIQQAVKAARATLDKFFKNTGTSNALAANVAVKVEVREGKVREYLWVTPFSNQGKGYSGTLNDIPHKVKHVTTGQQVQFNRADIVDWAYTDLHERRLKGNYTTCVMLRRGPDSDRALMKASYGLDCDRLDP